jgi:hypothetical protein
MLALFLAAFIGPGLISPDLHNNALSLYLARPFSRAEYVLGTHPYRLSSARLYRRRFPVDQPLFRSGQFFASAQGKFTGPIQAQRHPHLHDRASQEAAWQAVVNVSGIDLSDPASLSAVS